MGVFSCSPRVRFSRQAVFRRDGFAGQYCGARPRELTLGHVQPRHRGGPDTWENVVAACRRCNGKKGGRTPAEARMRLRSTPRAPRPTPSALLGLDNVRESWRPYVAWTNTPAWRLP